MKVFCIEDRRLPFVEVFRRTAQASGYDLTLGPPAAEPCAGFAELARNYVHLSPNSPGFELACFRRFFEVARMAGPDERVIISDSDIYVQAGPEGLPAPVMDLIGSGASGGIAASIGMLNGAAEYDASPHFSFWTGKRLREFCDYLIATYAGNVAALEALHAKKLASGAPYASISDMTLIRMWTDDAGVPLLNTNAIAGDRYLDHNISTPDASNGSFRWALGRKALRVEAGGVSYIAADGRPIRPATLHLQGRYKVIARWLEQRSALGVLGGSLYIAAGRAGRRLIGAMR
jgi:hypothetical protein